MDIYDRLGVRKIINAAGVITAFGGSLMPPESFQAISEAGKSFVDLDELLRRAGSYIAELLGVEAAYVCSGAAGGMVLAAAACLTGTDQDRIRSLPDTEGWRNEIVVQATSGHAYVYQGMRHTGARLVHVGDEHEMTLADIGGGLSPRTVAIMLYLGIHVHPPISEIATVAQEAGVRLIIDAASQLPPRSNFTVPLSQGADLIVFSGGKGIFGPQATGLILGKQELIDACRLNSNPHSAIGRPMKVGKEEIAALVAALEVFCSRDEGAEIAEYKRRAEYVVGELQGIEGIDAQVREADPMQRPVIPRVFIDLSLPFPLSGGGVRQRMLDGDLPVAILEQPNGVRVDVMLLQERELRAVARKLRGILLEGSRRRD